MAAQVPAQLRLVLFDKVDQRPEEAPVPRYVATPSIEGLLSETLPLEKLGEQTVSTTSDTNDRLSLVTL